MSGYFVYRDNLSKLRVVDPGEVYEREEDGAWWDHFRGPINGWCLDARRWLAALPTDDPNAAWRTCPVGAWLIFFLTDLLDAHGANYHYSEAYGNALSYWAYGDREMWARGLDSTTVLRHQRAADAVRSLYPDFPLVVDTTIPMDILRDLAWGQIPDPDDLQHYLESEASE